MGMEQTVVVSWRLAIGDLLEYRRTDAYKKENEDDGPEVMHGRLACTTVHTTPCAKGAQVPDEITPTHPAPCTIGPFVFSPSASGTVQIGCSTLPIVVGKLGCFAGSLPLSAASAASSCRLGAVLIVEQGIPAD